MKNLQKYNQKTYSYAVGVFEMLHHVFGDVRWRHSLRVASLYVTCQVPASLVSLDQFLQTVALLG